MLCKKCIRFFHIVLLRLKTLSNKKNQYATVAYLGVAPEPQGRTSITGLQGGRPWEILSGRVQSCCWDDRKV